MGDHSDTKGKFLNSFTKGLINVTSFLLFRDDSIDQSNEADGHESNSDNPYYSAVAENGRRRMPDPEVTNGQEQCQAPELGFVSLGSRAESKNRRQQNDKDSSVIANAVQKFFDRNEERLLRFPLPPSTTDSTSDTANNNNVSTQPSLDTQQQNATAAVGPASTPPRGRHQFEVKRASEQKLLKSPSFDSGPFVRSFMDSSAAETSAREQQMECSQQNIANK